MKKLIVLIAMLLFVSSANAYCSPKDGFTEDCDFHQRDIASLGTVEDQRQTMIVNSMIDPMSRGTKVTIDGKEYRCIQHSDDSIECENISF